MLLIHVLFFIIDYFISFTRVFLITMNIVKFHKCKKKIVFNEKKFIYQTQMLHLIY